MVAKKESFQKWRAAIFLFFFIALMFVILINILSRYLNKQTTIKVNVCQTEQGQLICPSQELLPNCQCDTTQNSIICLEFTNDTDIWVFPSAPNLRYLSFSNRSFEILDLKNVKPRILSLSNNEKFKDIRNLPETITSLSLSSSIYANDIFNLDTIFNSTSPCMFSLHIHSYYLHSLSTKQNPCKWADTLDNLHIRLSNMTRIAPGTFKCMHNLRDIDLSTNQIDIIENSLVFDSRQNITVDISENKITSGQLAKSGLEKNTNKVKLYTCSNNITTLDEKMFKRIADKSNLEMHLCDNCIDWSDPRHKWIENNEKYKSRFLKYC